MGMFNFWKKETPQLPTAEQLEEQRKEEENKQHKTDLEDRLNSLDRFPGSLSEYISLKREEGLNIPDTIVIMSTGRPEKFVYDPILTEYVNNREPKFSYKEDRELLLELVSKGCIGLIRYQISYNSDQSYNGKRALGIPVRIKNNGPYR